MTNNFINEYLTLFSNGIKEQLENNVNCIFPIQNNILLEAVQNSVLFTESKDPKYFIQLAKDLQSFTIENANKTYINNQQLLLVLPQLKNYKLPNIYIGYFDFNNKERQKQFLNNISNTLTENTYTIFNLILSQKQYKGCFIDLTKFNINLRYFII